MKPRIAIGESLATAALAAAISAPFAFRDGLPALRQDWAWPANSAEFHAWLVNGFSAWQTGGFGSANAGATVNLVLLLFVALAALGLTSKAVLFCFLSACFFCAHRSAAALLRIVAGIDAATAFFLAAAYAYGPVVFQKTIAGHLYYLAAYAVLPLFVYSLVRLNAHKRVAAVWVAIASLSMSIAAAQVQFLLFMGFLWVVLALVTLPRTDILRYGGLVMFVVLAHDAGLFAAHGAAGIATLDFNHATRQWEIDMSAPLLSLAALGGYLHYDLQALATPWNFAYAGGRWLIVVCACVGGALAVLRGRCRRAAIVSLIVCLSALFVAAGWYGPLAPVLQAAMMHSPFFTLVRELYHVMALYALGSLVLAGIALGSIRREFRVGVAVAICLVSLPFLCGGLERLVPSVPIAAFTDTPCGGARSALLPQWQPVGLTSGPYAGIDPAWRMPNAVLTDTTPIAIRAMLDAPAVQRELLREAGIDCVAWRARVVSRLPKAFEPNTGANFERFTAREFSIERRLTSPFRIANAMPALRIEPVDAIGSLDRTLPDAAMPRGAPALFSWSYRDNDIRRSWVSTRLWAWYSPEISYTVGSPVLTLSNAPLELQLPASQGNFLYVLASGTRADLNGRKAVLLGVGRLLPYHWFRWNISGNGPVKLVLPNGGAVVRAIRSSDAGWTPRTVAATPAKYDVLSTQMARSYAGILPRVSSPRQIVLLQTFDPAWTMSINGRNIASSRIHGLFNGWKIAASDSGARYQLFYAPDKLAKVLNLAGNAPLAIAVLWSLIAVTVGRKRPHQSGVLERVA